MPFEAICAILFMATIPVTAILGGIALHFEQAPRKRRNRRNRRAYR